MLGNNGGFGFGGLKCKADSFGGKTLRVAAIDGIAGLAAVGHICGDVVVPIYNCVEVIQNGVGIQLAS